MFVFHVSHDQMWMNVLTWMKMAESFTTATSWLSAKIPSQASCVYASQGIQTVCTSRERHISHVLKAGSVRVSTAWVQHGYSVGTA